MAYLRGCDSDGIFKQKAKRGTARLLERLIRFHDVEEAIEPTPPVIPDEPEVIPEIIDPLFIVDRLPRVMDVKRATSRYFKLSPCELESHHRTAALSYSRHIAMYLCRAVGRKSYPEIARRMGGRDHTTAMYAFTKIENLILSDWTVAYDIAQIECVIVGDCSNAQVR